MVKYFVFLTLLFLCSCTAPEVENSSTTLIPEKSKVFLTKDEIFTALNTKGVYMDEPLTEADKERMKSLIDPGLFFPKNQKMLRHKKQLKFKGVATIDLRSRDTKIKSQDDGKCTAFAGTAALENMMNKDKTIADLDLSEWDVWSKYQQYSCEAFINALSKNKVCDEKYYPQYGTRSTNCSKTAYVKLANSTYIEDDINKMTAALDAGNVVYIGMSTPTDMIKCKKVISPNTSVSTGGHALLINGYYKDQGQVVAIIRNSWGSDCGDAGYQYMPMSVCSKKGMYCVMWTINKVEVSSVVDVPTTPTCLRWSGHWFWKKCVEWSS